MLTIRIGRWTGGVILWGEFWKIGVVRGGPGSCVDRGIPLTGGAVVVS